MKQPIKTLAALALTLLLTVAGARAGIDIPDGNPLGVASTINVSGLSGSIGNNLTLTLNVSGGNNGDLYAYLSYGGSLVTLLNRPGVTGGNPLGNTDAGYNVTIMDGAFGSLNTASGGSPVTGTYNAGTATAFGDAFGALTGNGTWTLFIADMSGGDLSGSQLVNWTLAINDAAVPEPTTWALGIFGVLGVAFVTIRHFRAQAGRMA